MRTTDRVPYAALVRARFLLPDQSLSGCDMKSFALLTRLLKSRNELPGGIPDPSTKVLLWKHILWPYLEGFFLRWLDLFLEYLLAVIP